MTEPVEHLTKKDRRTLYGVAAAVAIGTAAAAGVVTCLGHHAGRSADALGSALSAPMGALPKGAESAAVQGGMPASTPTGQAQAPSEGAATPPEPVGQATVTGAAVEGGGNGRSTPTVPQTTRTAATLGPGAPAPTGDAGVGEGAPPAMLTTSSAPDGGMREAFAGDAGMSGAAPAAPAAAPIGAGAFTEPPPWGASSFPSNPDGGAGRFQTEWPPGIQTPTSPMSPPQGAPSPQSPPPQSSPMPQSATPPEAPVTSGRSR